MLDSDQYGILIVGYARRDGIIRILNKVVDLGFKRIYVAIDGPKELNQDTISEAILIEITKLRSKNDIFIRTWIREKNLGLSVSMITAIDWFFIFEESGLILEDDIEITEEFTEFITLNKGILQKDKVLMISGNNFSEHLTEVNCLVSYPLIWGWFTNKKSWTLMRGLILKPQFKFQVKKKLSVFGFFIAGSIKARYGSLDSWALPLAAGFHLNEYYCLIPAKNLVKNLGDDEYATHTISFNDKNRLNVSRDQLNQTKSSTDVLHNRKMDDYLEDKIYKVKKRNVLSPAKSMLQLLSRAHSKNLSSRISEVIIPNS
ncbi:MAG: hypothetical protein RLZ10_1946 [Bacteroidota bacterium]|jgi:hypothetical protein